MNDPAANPSSPDPVVAVNLLGPVTVTVDGEATRIGGPRQVAVLARLALSPGVVVSMSELVEALWDDEPNRPEVAIRSYVSNLRRSIEPDRHRGQRHSLIESSPPGYRLAVAAERVDAVRYEAALVAAREALAADRPAQAVEQLARAEELWRGEPCAGLTDTDPILGFRVRMEELRAAAAEWAFDARLRLGHHEAVIPDLESALAANPLRERLTELAMTALYQVGRQSDALALYRRLRERLVDELGVNPGQRLQDLEHRILTQDPTLDGGSDSTAPPPDRLRSTGPAPTERTAPAGVGLVGRSRSLEALSAVDRALSAGRGATAVVTGEPGIGKSALVAAYGERLAAQSVTVVWSHCRAFATSHQLWAWGQLLDGLRHHLGADELVELDRVMASAPEPVDAFRPVADAVRNLARRGPLVLVFDDIHWADDASLELMELIGSMLIDQPIGLVLTWSPTDRGAGRPTVGRLGRLANTVARVQLGGLEHDEVAELATAAGMTWTLDRHELDRFGGNPALVSAAVAGGPTGGRTGGLAVREVVLDWLDRASTGGRGGRPGPDDPDRLRQVAAVGALHRSAFAPDVVAEVAGLGLDEVERALAVLVAGGLVTDADVWGRYRFVHPVTAEVLVAEVPQPNRARLHATIGHALWRRGAPPSELAFQFAGAGSAGTTILAARFAAASDEPLPLATIVALEPVVRDGLDAVVAIGEAPAIESELALHLAQLARLRGRPAEAEQLAGQALAAARRADLALGTAVLGATGPGLAPAFSRAGWLTSTIGVIGDGATAAARSAIDEALWAARRERERRLDQSEGGGSSDAALAAAGVAGALVVRARRLAPRPATVAAPSATTSVSATARTETPGLSVIVDRLPVGDDPIGVLAHAYELGLEAVVAGSAEQRHEVARLVEAAVLAAQGWSPGPTGRAPSAGGRTVEDGDDPSEEPAWPTIGDRSDRGHELLLAARLDLLVAIERGDPGGLTAAVDRAARVVPSTSPTLTLPAAADRWTAVDLDRLSIEIAVDLLLGRLDRAGGELDAVEHRCDRWGIRPRSFRLQRLLLTWQQDRIAATELVGEAVSAAVGPSSPAETPGDGLSLEQAALAALRAHHIDDSETAERVLPELVASPRAPVASPGAEVIWGPAGYFAGLAAATVGRTDLRAELWAEVEAQAVELGTTPWLDRLRRAGALQSNSNRSQR